MDWQAFGAVSTAINTFLVLVGLIWIAGQVHELRRARNSDLIRWSFDAFTQSPVSLAAEQVTALMDGQGNPKDEEEARYIRHLSQLIENLGLLHYQGAIEEELVFGYYGDIIHRWPRLREIELARGQAHKNPIGPIFAEYLWHEWEKWVNSGGLASLHRRVAPTWSMDDNYRVIKPPTTASAE